MGYPKLLTSDRGSEFRNWLDTELMAQLGIHCHYTTANHPQVMRFQFKLMRYCKGAWFKITLLKAVLLTTMS